MLVGRQVLVVDASGNQCCAVVVEVVVQLAVTSTEFLLLQEERVVEQSESIQDVELGLE